MRHGVSCLFFVPGTRPALNQNIKYTAPQPGPGPASGVWREALRLASGPGPGSALPGVPGPRAAGAARVTPGGGFSAPASPADAVPGGGRRGAAGLPRRDPAGLCAEGGAGGGPGEGGRGRAGGEHGEAGKGVTARSPLQEPAAEAAGRGGGGDGVRSGPRLHSSVGRAEGARARPAAPTRAGGQGAGGGRCAGGSAGWAAARLPDTRAPAAIGPRPGRSSLRSPGGLGGAAPQLHARGDAGAEGRAGGGARLPPAARSRCPLLKRRPPAPRCPPGATLLVRDARDARDASLAARTSAGWGSPRPPPPAALAHPLRPGEGLPAGRAAPAPPSSVLRPPRRPAWRCRPRRPGAAARPARRTGRGGAGPLRWGCGTAGRAGALPRPSAPEALPAPAAPGPPEQRPQPWPRAPPPLRAQVAGDDRRGTGGVGEPRSGAAGPAPLSLLRNARLLG